MRIALLAYRGSMQSGGLGIYIHALTRELVSQGHVVELFVGPPYPDPLPWLREHHLPNERYWDQKFRDDWWAPISQAAPGRVFSPLHFWEFFVTRFGFFPEPFAFSLRAARAVIARVREGARFDVVHDVQTLGYGSLWLARLGVPVVATVHHPLTVDLRSSLQRDTNFREHVGTLTFHPVRTQARVARRLDAVITSSEASVDQIEEGFGVDRGRIHNLGNGVELPPAGSLRPAPDPPELLFLGRCGDPNKGLEFLLAALDLLPEPIRLRVLDNEPPPGELGGLLDDPKLSDRVDFDGKLPRAELEAALRRASVLVVPSLFEGFGLPAIEALASGTPIVASDAGALPEVIRNAGAGRLVPPARPRELAAGITDVLASWDEEHRLALAARERIERRFGWSEVARRTAEVYARVCGTPSRIKRSA